MHICTFNGSLAWAMRYKIQENGCVEKKLSKSNKNFNSKLALKYVQCRVKEVTDSLIYRLQTVDGKNIEIWHIKDLKSNSSELIEIESAEQRRFFIQ